METREREVAHGSECVSVEDVTAAVEGGREGGRKEGREGGTEKGMSLCSSMSSSFYHSLYTPHTPHTCTQHTLTSGGRRRRCCGSLPNHLCY